MRVFAMQISPPVPLSVMAAVRRLFIRASAGQGEISTLQLITAANLRTYALQDIERYGADEGPVMEAGQRVVDSVGFDDTLAAYREYLRARSERSEYAHELREVPWPQE